MTEQPLLIRLVYKIPLALAAMIGGVYSVYIALNFRVDTTNVTNAGFAIMASLSAISFSFARVIETDELRDRIMFAGERLLHASILILTASILKYFIITTTTKFQLFANSANIELVFLYTIGLLAALIFANGVMFAHTGLKVLNDILLLRFTRHNDWDDLW